MVKEKGKNEPLPIFLSFTKIHFFSIYPIKNIYIQVYDDNSIRFFGEDEDR